MLGYDQKFYLHLHIYAKLTWMLQAVSSLAHLLLLLSAYFCHCTAHVVHLGLEALALKDLL
jgi:hypothetical protein